MSDPSDEESEDFVYVAPRKHQSTDVPTPFALLTLKGHDLYEISVSELHHLYAVNAFTVKEYTQFCLDQIQKTNFYLEAVIETNPDALTIASELDADRVKLKSASRGALWGVPVLVKDSMATKDKMETCAGSWALLGSVVPKDAFIVSRLRQAGAIVLGKSNLDEWAGMRCIDSYSTGYSARGGQCRNPYRLSRSPEGSSSGSAVTGSANIVPLAFGTETDTSIIGPALVNRVVGIKPTVGLTSRAGIVPISNTQDSIGPYGRTVADVAVALDIIAAGDPDDEFTVVPSRKQPKSYLNSLVDRHALKGAKFGLPMRRFWDVAPQPQRKVVEQLLILLKESGAEIIEVNMPSAEERIHADGHWDWTRYSDSHPEKSELTVSKVQTYKLMMKYLSALSNTSMRSLEDIVRYNDDNTGSEGGIPGSHPAFPTGQDLFRDCVATQGIEDDTYKSALHWTQKQTRENGIDAVLSYKGDASHVKELKLDALIFCDIKMGGTCIAAQAGYPVLALPVGLDPEGMPVGITLIHTAWEEARLIKWASAIEDLMTHHAGQLLETRTGRSSAHLGPQVSTSGAATHSQPIGRVAPTFKDHLRKNIPIEYGWRYDNAMSNENLRPFLTTGGDGERQAPETGDRHERQSLRREGHTRSRPRLVDARWRIPAVTPAMPSSAWASGPSLKE